MGVPKKDKGPRTPTGRFLPCPASYVAHELVAVEVIRGTSGKYFYLCGECMTRVFLNTWGEGWGFTLAHVEGQGARIVGLSPLRRMQLLQQDQPKR